jgi:hypothetical protein
MTIIFSLHIQLLRLPLSAPLQVISKLLLVFLPNTDRLQQVEDYVRGCRKLLKYLPCILPAAQLCFIFMPTYKYPIASVSPYDKNSP